MCKKDMISYIIENIEQASDTEIEEFFWTLMDREGQRR